MRYNKHVINKCVFTFQMAKGILDNPICKQEQRSSNHFICRELDLNIFLTMAHFPINDRYFKQ